MGIMKLRILKKIDNEIHNIKKTTKIIMTWNQKTTL